MIVIKYRNQEYAYIPKRACWVDNTNKVVSSDTQKSLRNIAIGSGYKESDFDKPSGEMEQFISMPQKRAAKEVKVKKKRNPRLKSSTAVSLKGILKPKE